MILESINFLNAKNDFVLVMESITLLFWWIHLSLAISHLPYNWQGLITSILKYFSRVSLQFTRELYRDFESVYRIKEILNSSIFSRIALMIALISNAYAILYNLVISMFLVTHFNWINDQRMTLALLVQWTRYKRKPICDKRGYVKVFGNSVCLITRFS